jgi:hypothetical protein
MSNISNLFGLGPDRLPLGAAGHLGRHCAGLGAMGARSSSTAATQRLQKFAGIGRGEHRKCVAFDMADYKAVPPSLAARNGSTF